MNFFFLYNHYQPDIEKSLPVYKQLTMSFTTQCWYITNKMASKTPTIEVKPALLESFPGTGNAVVPIGHVYGITSEMFVSLADKRDAGGNISSDVLVALYKTVPIDDIRLISNDQFRYKSHECEEDNSCSYHRQGRCNYWHVGDPFGVCDYGLACPNAGCSRGHIHPVTGATLSRDALLAQLSATFTKDSAIVKMGISYAHAASCSVASATSSAVASATSSVATQPETVAAKTFDIRVNLASLGDACAVLAAAGISFSVV